MADPEGVGQMHVSCLKGLWEWHKEGTSTGSRPVQDSSNGDGSDSPYLDSEEGSMYLQNVGNSANVHTLQRLETWININSEPPCKP
jgi:hypothetical protein